MQAYRLVIWSSLFWLLALPAFSQTLDCALALNQAEQAFDDGLFDNIEPALLPCLRGGKLNREEKVRAYRLLCLLYLYQDYPQKAEEAMQKLLTLAPEYQYRSDEPNEFKMLHRRFRIIPHLIVGGGGGLNYSRLLVQEYYSTDIQPSETKYAGRWAYQGGIYLAKPLSFHWAMHAQLFFTSRSYASSQALFGYSRLEVIERQNSLQAQLSVQYNLNNKYNFSLRGHNFYLQGGVAMARHLSSTADFLRTDAVGNINRSVEDKNYAIDKLRTPLLLWIQAGMGFEYKLGIGHLLLAVNAYYPVNLANNPQNRFSDTALIARYGYIDNNFSWAQVQINFGYMYPLYRPKIKRKKHSGNNIKVVHN